jgi:hypothetical protein
VFSDGMKGKDEIAMASAFAAAMLALASAAIVVWTVRSVWQLTRRAPAP